LIAALLVAALTAADGSRASRLSELQQEILRLQRERDGLATRERGLLGDVARIDAEIALHRARFEEATTRLRDTEERLADSDRALADLDSAQGRRGPVLAARLREMYKMKAVGWAALVLAPLRGGQGFEGLRYAGYLARRDARQIAAWRHDAARLDAGRAALAGERGRLLALQTEAGREGAALEAGRAARASLLSKIRDDRLQHDQALGELETAARELSRLVGALEGDGSPPALDVRKFRGLLDWPASGTVSAGFGPAVHPKFKTETPHPGLDIDAAPGSPIRAVFDGRVAYASQLHGYGLTAVVDHGNGVISVYAHAEALTVSPNDEVRRGQELGRVGESGSLRGPYLYFELREAGKPVDPVAWLRKR